MSKINCDFMSAEEFRISLGVSKSTLALGMKAGKYPYSCYIRLGRRIKFPRSLLSKLTEVAFRKAEKTSETQDE